jgi:hypothetical protein
MAHSMLRTSLKAAADAARTAADPMVFLNRLESIHPAWHLRTFVARRYGFLTFHWVVIEEFKRAKCPSLWPSGIRAFTAADFTTFGWPYNVTSQARANDFASLATFSTDMEAWHNDAHMAVGMYFNIEDEMMNPAQNIYRPQFWRLHYFINGKFLAELRRYDSTGSAKAKIGRLETAQHANLYRI